MIVEGFANGDSLIHRLDPRVKIIVASLFSTIVAVSDRFQSLLPALVIGFILVVLSAVPIKKLFMRLVPVNGFIVFLWFFLPFTFDGEPLFAVGPLVATNEGVYHATRITLKSNAIIVVLIALVASTPVFTLGHALHELRIPNKIVHLLFFTYRYIHVMYREYLRLVNAMKIRNFRPATNIHTYRTFAYLVGMLLVKSHERAKRVYNAMLCRGFRGRLYSLSRFSLKPIDVISFILMLAAILGLAVLEWTRITL